MNIEDGEGTPKQEVTDGAENEATQEDNNAQPQPGGEADLNGGGADPETGEDGGENEGPDPAAEESAKPDVGVEEILQKVKEELKAEIAPLKEQLQQQPQRQITEEEWVAHEQKWGIPRNAIQQVTSQSVKLYNRIMSEIDQKLGGIQKDLAITNLAKERGFADIPSLRSGIEEFLKKYDQKHHANPDLLRTAAIYARGLKANANVTRARQSDEKNRQVVGRIKTGKQEVNAKTKSNKALSEAERQAAEMLGSEEEYRRLKDPSRRIIAA